jgi:Binding-protein-dependent transport system inner membrane component
VAVFVFYSFLKQIPVSLIEAARLDGASWWRVYYQLCMPLSRPAIAAVAILTFHHHLERLPLAAPGTDADEIGNDHGRTEQPDRRVGDPVGRDDGILGTGLPAAARRIPAPAAPDRPRCRQHRHQIAASQPDNAMRKPPSTAGQKVRA